MNVHTFGKRKSLNTLKTQIVLVTPWVMSQSYNPDTGSVWPTGRAICEQYNSHSLCWYPRYILITPLTYFKGCFFLVYGYLMRCGYDMICMYEPRLNMKICLCVYSIAEWRICFICYPEKLSCSFIFLNWISCTIEIFMFIIDDDYIIVIYINSCWSNRLKQVYLYIHLGSNECF